ncbi:hypothetical protein BD779DRAFT_1605868 [Infundibulicybe gibba]|nr:hypothetical protein BD779DRAFT_1605868 [Infundibulicybe gibba]
MCVCIYCVFYRAMYLRGGLFQMLFQAVISPSTTSTWPHLPFTSMTSTACKPRTQPPPPFSATLTSAEASMLVA